MDFEVSSKSWVLFPSWYIGLAEKKFYTIRWRNLHILSKSTKNSKKFSEKSWGKLQSYLFVHVSHTKQLYHCAKQKPKHIIYSTVNWTQSTYVVFQSHNPFINLIWMNDFAWYGNAWRMACINGNSSHSHTKAKKFIIECQVLCH